MTHPFPPAARIRAATALRLVCVLCLTTLAACVDTAAPAVAVQIPGTAAAVEPQSGIEKEALIAVSYMRSEKTFVVLYLPAKIDVSQKAAAPARLCASRNFRVGSVEDKPPEHPSELPGAMKLVVRCR